MIITLLTWSNSVRCVVYKNVKIKQWGVWTCKPCIKCSDFKLVSDRCEGLSLVAADICYINMFYLAPPSICQLDGPHSIHPPIIPRTKFPVPRGNKKKNLKLIFDELTQFPGKDYYITISVWPFTNWNIDYII